MYGERFDHLFAAGRATVLTGRQHRDSPPVDGGRRWGVSVVLRPDPAPLAALAEVAAAAMALAGPGHWPTGAAHTSHLTVRALEPHRDPLPAGDAAIERYVAAVRRAAKVCGPVRFRLRGLTLTEASVMGCAYPMDGAADAFAAGLADELADDGWYEAGFHRNIWYANVVHFAAPIADPAGLVAWVADRRSLEFGEVLTAEAELVRWRFDGCQAVREPLVTVPLAASG